MSAEDLKSIVFEINNKEIKVQAMRKLYPLVKDPSHSQKMDLMQEFAF